MTFQKVLFKIKKLGAGIVGACISLKWEITQFFSDSYWLRVFIDPQSCLFPIEKLMVIF